MARIVVQTDDKQRVLLDERHIHPDHLEDEHSAVQLLERLEWAVRDAESFRETLARRLEAIRQRRLEPEG